MGCLCAHRADETVPKQRLPIALRGILRPSVRVMNAAWRRVSPLDCGVQRGQRQADVDRAADGIADRSARPGVEDHRDVGEAFTDGDVRDVRDPELVRPINRQVLGAIGMDRLVVVAVGRGDIGGRRG